MLRIQRQLKCLTAPCSTSLEALPNIGASNTETHGQSNSTGDNSRTAENSTMEQLLLRPEPVSAYEDFLTQQAAARFVHPR